VEYLSLFCWGWGGGSSLFYLREDFFVLFFWFMNQGWIWGFVEFFCLCGGFFFNFKQLRVKKRTSLL